MQTGNGRPYPGGRVMRLLAEGLISPDADIGALQQPVHAERLEYLLTVIACAVSRQRSDQVAPWTRQTSTLAQVKAALQR